ncbi:MAG: AAA family ATPase [bacterium]|nr:AAA family ATPase [bacterium]
MRLKKLELSGFKSFPKHTVLEFPSKITAVVGPNGSGKSNIKESIQWVLGEQSMKSLRGKRGEDLIWNGSPNLPRMGKALVTLVFDNKDGKIPLDFEEVSIGRKIFRDGLNEYYLNGSQVRLRDVIELTARMGLGETKHNIIGQGEVDRFLMASPADKRAMLEEALGLRVYQLKKNETERKLASTENNVKQVESLLREIAPHLKFLRGQTEKHRARAGLEEEITKLKKIYLSLEKIEIESNQTEEKRKSAPLVEQLAGTQKEIKSLAHQIGLADKRISVSGHSSSKENEILASLNAKRRELEREIGRLEGKTELEKEKISRPTETRIDVGYIIREIENFILETKTVLSKADVIKTHLESLVSNLENLLGEIKIGRQKNKIVSLGENIVLVELQKATSKLQSELSKINLEAEKIEGRMREEQNRFWETQAGVRELDAKLRFAQNAERDFMLKLERFKFEEERIKDNIKEYEKNLHEAGLTPAELFNEVPAEYQSFTNEELRRKIDRLHARLDEAGGIDETVIKEFEELEARHSFLSKELADLKQAHVSLKELLKELEGYIKTNFKEGFLKIKDEFNKFFRIIFGGGKASLQLIKPARKIDEDEVGIEEEKEEGLEISVDLPSKRIKGLAMLSGGERALTSIALLFAITAINPPPFLILDETDAALDEANTQRYAAILKELSDKTQLIIVTHNRETMKSAGVLYGITMGDDGASKLLSIRLEEAESYTSR